MLILDAPCGYGRFSALALEQPAFLVSVDISQSMVSRALEKVESGPGSGAAHRETAGVVADLKSGLPFKADAFDMSLSMRFFHHLHREEDRLAVVAELCRVSKGPVIISYYRMSRLHAWQRKVRSALKKRPYQVKMLSSREFEREAAGSGLRLVRSFSLFRGLHAQCIGVFEKIKM